MRLSPARAHRERMLGQVAATQAATTAGVRTGRAASEYELVRAQLGVDLRRLKEIQSVERKIELKRELLPTYGPWVEGVLAADSGAPDDILTHVMIWRIDTGDFAGALPLAAHVVRHKLPLPERFDRTAPTLIAEEIADSALKLLGQGEDADRDVLMAVDDMLEDEDIFDQVRAKLEKAIGLQLVRDAESIAVDADGPAGARRAGLEGGLRRLRRAQALDDKAGVKKRIEQVERAIKTPPDA